MSSASSHYPPRVRRVPFLPAPSLLQAWFPWCRSRITVRCRKRAWILLPVINCLLWGVVNGAYQWEVTKCVEGAVGTNHVRLGGRVWPIPPLPCIRYVRAAVILTPAGYCGFTSRLWSFSKQRTTTSCRAGTGPCGAAARTGP